MSIGLALLSLGAQGATVAKPKRVLIVHSFGSTAPPFTTHSTAFETTLTEGMGERVDIDEVSLDMARYAQPEMQEAFVEFLRNRLTKWQPDLVVPIGSPAGRFVAQFRNRLFLPKTTILYSGLDQSLLPPDALQTNAVFIGDSYSIPGFMEDMLQIAPDTTNVVVIIGASPLEELWAEKFRSGFEPYTNRVGLTFLNTLSFDQMREQVANLPPHSFIFLGLLVRDASGVTLNEDDALQRLHGVASAPINGIFLNQLGLGIVGGRLYDAENIGVETARVAIRLLHGDSVSNFPPRVIPAGSPRYDWRELRRWKISEARLPVGSVVEFRQRGAWERYRWLMIGACLITVAETTLIIGLVVNLVKRRRTQKSLQDSEERLSLATDSAGTGLWSVEVGTRRVWVTPQFRELFEFSPEEEITYNSFLGKIHPDDRESVRRAGKQSLEQAETFRMEFRIVLADGNLRWIVTRGRPHFNSAGKPVRLMGVAVDFTDRRTAEASVAESQARIVALVENTEDMIWSVDPQRFGLVTFNSVLRDYFLTQHNLEIHAGMTPDDLLPAPYAAEWHELYRRALRDGSYVTEYSTSSKTRTLLLTLNLLKRNGDVFGISVFGKDITARKQAEEALRESEERFRIVADSAPVLIWMSGLDKGCTFFNKPWLNFTGRTLEQEQGDGWTKGVHPDDRPGCLKTYANAFDARQPFVMQYRLRQHDGEYRWFADQGVPRHDAQGNFAGYIGSCVDITERTQTEERLRLDAAVMENMTDGVVLVRNRDHIIVHTNSTFDRIFGYEAGELIGQKIDVINLEQGPEEPSITETIGQSLRANGRWSGQIPNRRKDGTTIWSHVSITTFQHPVYGELGISIHTDITERRQNEEEMKRLRLQAWHADRVARTGAITSSLAHELNQPLAAVLSNAQAALRFLEKENPDLDEIREILGDIVYDDKRAGAVISGLRSMLRRKETQREKISLKATIRETFDLLHSELLGRQVEARLRCESDCFVVADKAQIQQVILNLMMNSIEALHEQPVNRRHLEVGLSHPKADTAQVAVRDSGPGIPDEQSGRLFEAFWTTKAQGMGIGLPICRSILESHGGRIWYAKNAEGGATFYFTLPVQTVAPLGRERIGRKPEIGASDSHGKG